MKLCKMQTPFRRINPDVKRNAFFPARYRKDNNKPGWSVIENIYFPCLSVFSQGGISTVGFHEKTMPSIFLDRLVKNNPDGFSLSGRNL